MSVEKFEKRAGSGTLQSTEDPAMQIVGDVIPEWVTVPDALGGGRRTVQGHKRKPCICELSGCDCGGHEAIVLDLGDNMFVAECEHKGFLWFRLRKGGQ